MASEILTLAIGVALGLLLAEFVSFALFGVILKKLLSWMEEK